MIYRSINFPTVPKGEERLRITPTPGHTVPQENQLILALSSVWNELNLKKIGDWKSIKDLHLSDRDGNSKRIWSDEQLGLKDGTFPIRIGRTENQLEHEGEKKEKNQVEKNVGIELY